MIRFTRHNRSTFTAWLEPPLEAQINKEGTEGNYYGGQADTLPQLLHMDASRTEDWRFYNEKKKLTIKHGSNKPISAKLTL